jgi:hypothetical protein
VGSDELFDAEHALLQALRRQDLDTLTALLADDFLITTAGWIAEPADKSTWLAGLAEHQLDEFELRLLAVPARQRCSRAGRVGAEGQPLGRAMGAHFSVHRRVATRKCGMALGCPSRVDPPRRITTLDWRLAASRQR